MAIEKAQKDLRVKKKVGANKIEDFTETSKGVEKDGLALGKDVQWEATKGEVHSDTHLEDDLGTGKKVVIRTFDFAVNPQAFHHHTPSRQELFNAHAKQIEAMLWADGLAVLKEHEPQIRISKNRKNYRIVVAAEARLGESIIDRAKTLTEIANGNP